MVTYYHFQFVILDEGGRKKWKGKRKGGKKKKKGKKTREKKKKKELPPDLETEK